MKIELQHCLPMLLICFAASVCALAAEPEASSDSSPATEPSVQELTAHISLVEEAYAILNRTPGSSAGPAPGDAVRASELATEFDRLIGQRQRYFGWLGELAELASSGSRSADMLPTLRRVRDSHESFMNSLQVNSPARRSIRNQWQQLNLQIGIEEERAEDESPAHNADLLAQLFLHVEVFVRTTFAHFEVAKARLEQEVLNRAVNVQTATILDTLNGYVRQALEFNAAVIESPQLTRRPSIVEGRIANQVRAYGEIVLAGASFNRQRHCRLAEFKAWEALSSLAQRMGVVVRGETRESCSRSGNKVGVWLSVPQENVVDFRASG